MNMFLITMNFIFLFLNHPMSMGMTLICQTIILSIISGMFLKSFWMSYIVVITMLSGMLVLFIYMSSVASNEKFKTSMKMTMYSACMLTMSTLFLFLSPKMIIKNNGSGMEMIISMNNQMIWLNKMFNMENTMTTIMMITYLLTTMIVSTHLINISEGPMRMKI